MEVVNVPVTAVEGEVSVGKAVSVEIEVVGCVVDCRVKTAWDVPGT